MARTETHAGSDTVIRSRAQPISMLPALGVGARGSVGGQPKVDVARAPREREQGQRDPQAVQPLWSRIPGHAGAIRRWLRRIRTFDAPTYSRQISCLGKSGAENPSV